jgi:glucan-binding YG repeat protein
MSTPEELNRSYYFVRGEKVRAHDDTHAIQQRESQSDSKIRYVLTDFSSLLTNQVKENDVYGLFAAKQFNLPNELIDESTKLKYATYTNDRARELWGDSPLPLNTLPAKYQGKYGDPDVENALQLGYSKENNKNSTNPRDNNLQNRTFAIFENTRTEIPDPLKSIEDPFFKRGGEFTRRYTTKTHKYT